MIDIEKVKDEIVTALLPLKPDKIIIFGSYARGEANKDSDLDIFLIKDEIKDFRKYEIEARKHLRSFILNHNTNGIDILSASSDYLKNRKDYFYKEILEKGVVLYE